MIFLMREGLIKSPGHAALPVSTHTKRLPDAAPWPVCHTPHTLYCARQGVMSAPNLVDERTSAYDFISDDDCTSAASVTQAALEECAPESAQTETETERIEAEQLANEQVANEQLPNGLAKGALEIDGHQPVR